MEAPGIEAEPERRNTSRCVASDDACSRVQVTSGDVARRGETEKIDPVERALADALTVAAAAGRFDVVSKLEDELAARRTAHATMVIDLGSRRRAKYVATGELGSLFQRDHRTPGTHPLGRGRRSAPPAPRWTA